MLHFTIWPSPPIQYQFHPFWLCNVFWFILLLSISAGNLMSKPKLIPGPLPKPLNCFLQWFSHTFFPGEWFLENVIYIMPVNFLKSCNSFPLDFEYNPHSLTWPSDPAPTFFWTLFLAASPFSVGCSHNTLPLLPRTRQSISSLKSYLAIHSLYLEYPSRFWSVFFSPFRHNLNSPVISYLPITF